MNQSDQAVPLPVPLPPVFALTTIVVQRLLPGRPTTSSRILGGVLGLTSVALVASAVSAFRARGTTLDPTHPEEATSLVTTGANAITRNPMYLGLLGGTLAHAVWRRSGWALIPVAAFAGWLDQVQVPAEEAALADKYGEKYGDYRSRVPRWVALRGRSGSSPD